MLSVEEDSVERDVQAAVGCLRFVYPDGEVGPREESSPGDPFRNFPEEDRAARILESLGATDLTQLEGVLPDFDSHANYLIGFADETHLGCSFTAHSVIELEKLGFVVRLEATYPFVTVPAESRWIGTVEPDEKLDWFHIELGVLVGGKAYNLVPALVEMLSQCGEGTELQSLANAPGRLRAVPLGDGRFVALPWQRLRRILLVLCDLIPSSRHAGELEVPMAHAMEIAHLEDAFTGTGEALLWSSDNDWPARAQKLKRGPTWSPQPAALRAELRPYQHEGLMWLEHKREAGVGAVLADDMGLGKTLQTIALLAREKEAHRMDIPSLVIAPTSLLGNWKRELEKFAPHLRALIYSGPKRHRLISSFGKTEIIITSYPVLVRDLTPLTDREFHYVILDEAQAIKNSRGLASTAVRTLSARHRVALSGTPVENNLQELWSLFEFSHPGLLGNQRQFRQTFADPIEKEGNAAQLEKLRARVSPFILRREKESVARDLPPKSELIRCVDLPQEQRDLYESIRLAADAEVRGAIKQNGLSGSAIAIVDALMKLRQVCCDPRLLTVESARSVKQSAKYEFFFELLSSQLASGRRMLVFSQFTRMLGLLGKGLQERGVPYLSLTGSSRNRQQLVDRFEAAEADVFLISLKAGGTGLNLVSADTVIHYDPWWNAAAQMQATDRAYRIGQKKPVFVHNLIATGSVEERMLALQNKKRGLSDALLGKGGNVPLLDEEELDHLMAPLPE